MRTEYRRTICGMVGYVAFMYDLIEAIQRLVIQMRGDKVDTLQVHVYMPDQPYAPDTTITLVKGTPIGGKPAYYDELSSSDPSKLYYEDGSWKFYWNSFMKTYDLGVTDDIGPALGRFTLPDSMIGLAIADFSIPREDFNPLALVGANIQLLQL